MGWRQRYLGLASASVAAPGAQHGSGPSFEGSAYRRMKFWRVYIGATYINGPMYVRLWLYFELGLPFYSLRMFNTGECKILGVPLAQNPSTTIAVPAPPS